MKYLIIFYIYLIFKCNDQNLVKNIKDLNNLMDKSDGEDTFLLYFEEDNFLKEIKNKLGSWINYLLVDKNIFKNNEDFKDLFKKEDNNIILIPFSASSRRFKIKKIFSKKNNIKDIASYLNEYFIDTVDTVDQTNFNQKLPLVINSGKFPVILFISNDDTLLTYKIIAKQKKFEYNFKFYVFKNTNEQIKTYFKLTRLPSLAIFLINNEPNKEGQKGLNIIPYFQSIIYNKVEGFLNGFEKSYLNKNTNFSEKKNEEELKKKEDKNVIEFVNQDSFSKYCNEKVNYCLLGIFNKNHDNEEKIKYLKNVQNIYSTSTLRVGYFDGICHMNLLSLFEISYDILPRAIFINNKKKEYSYILGKFDKDDLLFSFSKILKNQLQTNKLDTSKLKFNQKNCKEENKKFFEKMNPSKDKKEEEDDDDLVNQIIKESQEREKEKTLEKEKKRKRRRDDL